MLVAASGFENHIQLKGSFGVDLIDEKVGLGPGIGDLLVQADHLLLLIHPQLFHQGIRKLVRTGAEISERLKIVSAEIFYIVERRTF